MAILNFFCKNGKTSFKKVLKTKMFYGILTNMLNMPKWWNWQTRRTQNPVVAIPCGFKSHFRHQIYLQNS